MKSDLYSILGVSRAASSAEIKAAYRNRAKTAHPDRGGNREDFEKLGMSKLVLLDPRRRERYDRTGEIDQAPDNEFAETINIVMAAIDEVLSVIERRNADPCQFDLIGDAKNRLTSKIAQAEQLKASLLEGAKRIDRVAKKIKAKKGKLNRLSPIFDARKVDLEQRAEQQKHQIEQLKRAYDLLGEHDFSYAELVSYD